MDAWILEESIVDPPSWGRDLFLNEGNEVGWDDALKNSGRVLQDGKHDPIYGMQPRLRFSQANLNHRKFMHVIESGEIYAGPNQ